jgi:hypothetical protein
MYNKMKDRDHKSIIYGIIGVLLIVSVLGIVVARIMYKEPEKISPFQEKTSVTIGTQKAVLPEGYPVDTPVYADSELMSTTKMEVIGKYNYSVTYHIDKTKANPKQIIDYYTTELPKVRYSNITTQGEEPGAMLISNSVKGNNGETTINVSAFESEKDPNKNSINIEIQAYPR